MANKRPLVIETTLADAFSNLQKADTLTWQVDVSTALPKIAFAVLDDAGASAVDLAVSRNASKNLFLGVNQGLAITSGISNVGMGFEAGKSITSGSSNISIGSSAGTAIANGGSNVCIGTNAGDAIVDGSGNFALGTSALGANVSGGNNVCIGASAGGVATGSLNMFIGTNAGAVITTSNGNVMIGNNAGNNASQLVTAASSVAIGLNTWTGGSSSIAIGPTATTTGANAIAIGSAATAAANNCTIGASTQILCSIVGGLTVNSAAGDFDTTISGDTLSHMLFLDASAATENIALVAAAAPNWQSMDRGLFVGDATTIPTGNPASGVFMYSESGSLKVRDTAGDIKNVSRLVTGPAGATDDAIARYDGTTGELVDNSAVFIRDSGLFETAGGIDIDGASIFRGSVQFNSQPEFASGLTISTTGIAISVGDDVGPNVFFSVITDSGFAGYGVSMGLASATFFYDAAFDNISFFTGVATNWQSMDNGLFIGDAAVAPTGNPTAGTFVFGTSGDLLVRNTQGAVTTLSGITRGATASVADGGTVTHGLGTTPTGVVVTPTVSGEFVSVTAVGATTFTVAIKKHDNSAGTTQTLYWQAFK